MDIIYQDLCNIAGKESVSLSEDMRKHTTFKAGGCAKYFVCPDQVDSLAELISYVNKNDIKYYVIGNGSNLLVRDEGFDGVIVKIGNKLGNIQIKDDEMVCEAGAFVSKAANLAAEQSLAGLEFAAGIPGMIGGAAAMNAGAYGGEFKDIVECVWGLDRKGEKICLSNAQLEFGYRSSIIQKKDYIVTAVKLKLRFGNKEEIYDRMNGYLNARREKQPLEYPSAGSTFKRPEGYFAGKLIMDAGLAGMEIGGACVSEKHCGFIINKNNATAGDIIELIKRVSDIVYDKYNVILEPEVKII